MKQPITLKQIRQAATEKGLTLVYSTWGIVNEGGLWVAYGGVACPLGALLAGTPAKTADLPDEAARLLKTSLSWVLGYIRAIDGNGTILTCTHDDERRGFSLGKRHRHALKLKDSRFL